MHTRQTLLEAAAAAGCRVLAVRQQAISGRTVWSSTVDCPDSESAFRYLCELSDRDTEDEDVHALAGELVTIYGPDPELVARAVQKWVQQNVRYVKEPEETFQAAGVTLLTRRGDCDCHAALVRALVRAAGIGSRIVPLRRAGQFGAPYVKHAVSQAWVAGQWRWLETTLPARYDEEPVAALRRLRLGGRADIAA